MKENISAPELINYCIRLVRQLQDRHPALLDFIKFSLVGLSGMVVDLFFVYVSYEILSLPFRIARVAGFVFALNSNFLLNRNFTFPHARTGNIIKQYVLYFSICCVGIVFNWFISVYLYEHFGFFHQYYLIAAFGGILGGVMINFLGSRFFVFKK